MRALTTAAIVGMALVSGCAVANSAQPSGARLWTAADLESLDSALVAKMSGTGAAYTQIIKGKTYGALVLRREATGDPELHVKLNDFFVVLRGEGEIEVGGRVIGEKTIAADEKRGRKLVGGDFYKVKEGDVMFVPANHWLQVFVAQGKVLKTVIIKTQ
jgi:mannose-6-phosphate isomerase-like protein (cupin superfamily)